MKYFCVPVEPKMRACRSHPQGHQTRSHIRATLAWLMPEWHRDRREPSRECGPDGTVFGA